MARSDVIKLELRSALEKRAAAVTALDALRTKAAEKDSDVTAEQVREAQAARDAFDGPIDTLREQLAEAQAEEARDAELGALLGTIPAQPGQRGPPAGSAAVLPGAERDVQMGAEPRTYSEHNNVSGERVSFFQDAYRAQFQSDTRSQERINRHRREVEVEREQAGQQDRATTTGSYAGLVVPQYLTDMVAPVLRNGRPLANMANRHQLPDRGMSLIIPRGTTGATTAVQATENTALSNTDEAVANLTVPVVTIGGQQDVSRQALERGEMIDAFVYNDLARAHAANVDTQVISGTGASGQMLGVLNTAGIGAATAFGAAATITNVNLKIAGAITAVTSAGSGIYPKCLIMSPRRWGWFLGQVDGSGRPVVVANQVANFNAAAIVTKPGETSADGNPINGGYFVGMHSSGLPVLVDLNMPLTVGTNNEDLILAADLYEYHLWEEGDGAPKELKFEQTNGGALTTKLVVYSYAAFTAGRYPAATAKVGGLDTTGSNGLFAPTF
jgi:HK97 family phage major capsid protein